MSRLVAAIATFLTFWALTPTAWAVGKCEETDDGEAVVCPKERFQLFRDRGRVGELLCSALDTGTLDVVLDPELLAVCESASLTSRIWAEAQTWEEQDKAADEAQRLANVKEGRLAESRRDSEQKAKTIRQLRDQKRTRSPFSWLSFGACGGGVAIGGAQIAYGRPMEGGVTVGGSLVLCGVGALVE